MFRTNLASALLRRRGSTTAARRKIGPALMIGTVFGFAAPASAQWTLPKGQVVWSTAFDFQYADHEFFGQDGEPRARRPFPLRGEFFGTTMRFDARVGFTDELEFEFELPLRTVTYMSDPVLLLPQAAASGETSLDFYQRNIIHLSQATAGLADIQVIGRYRFMLQPFPLTGEVRLKVPGGYRGPAGTFGTSPRSAQELADNPERYVSPENVTDDVTLGDAQVDVVTRILAGASFDTGTFVAGDVGYNARFDNAGHQFVASIRAGQLIERLILPFVGASFAYTVTEGRVIGVSVAADDPELPAEEYGGLTNLFLREVRLERNFLDLYAGLIVRLTPDVELKLAYAQTLWGMNVAAVSTFSIGIGARTQLFGDAG